MLDVCYVHRYFSTIAYSADGETLLAAGKSKNVCIYRIAGGILLKKLEITQNHSLDGLDVSVTEIRRKLFVSNFDEIKLTLVFIECM